MSGREMRKSACLIPEVAGIGLVVFSAASTTDANFQAKVWATPHYPNPYYANDKAKDEVVRRLFD